MKYIHVFCLLLFFINAGWTQQSRQMSSGEIYEALEKFNFLGSVLYVAAHPDDENTRLISYLSNGLHARTAYLSLTRGDGGQNLIGTEIRELLGVLRSQELQMARRIDGGQQFFTRANDFGYSKHPDETLTIWDENLVFDDVIRVIRTFRPDVIINRFDHRTPGRTHGHHTSSAILSVNAFDKTNNPAVFPSQLKNLSPWQPRRLFFNTSWWFYGSREAFAEADKSRLMSLEVGGFYPTLGMSNNEISGMARSQHRSQGFGSSGARGSYQEYLELIEGDMPADKENIFDGINTSWTRVKGGEPIYKKMDEIMAEYDFRNPSTIVPDLLEIYRMLDQVEDPHWREIKREELKSIILNAMGLFAEIHTDVRESSHGDTVTIEIEITNRSNIPARLIQYAILDSSYHADQLLEPFTENKLYTDFPIHKNIPFSNPYWLVEESPAGVYNVEDPEMRIKPESDAAIGGMLLLEIEGIKIPVRRDLIYKTVDPSVGEIRQPFVIIPPATMQFNKDLYLLSDIDSQVIEIKVRASRDSLSGVLRPHVPPDWSLSPESRQVSISNKGMESIYRFNLKSPRDISEGIISAEFTTAGETYDKSLVNIDYEHIPLQTVLLPAKSRIVKVPLKTGGREIGYIMGAGDKMPESLRAVGYNVTLLELSELGITDLGRFDAIIIGIRAYNTLDNLWLYNDLLFDYAKAGGTLVTQYNTSRRLDYDQLAPYPIKLSRARITDENAPLKILNPDHPVLNFPNMITQADFQGWVQERGLYFPEEWDSQYEVILEGNDPGEDPLRGSLLIAEHGAGYFVYTGLSWFRQLPAGVAGAYRLFANILALGSGQEDHNENRP